MFLYQHHMATKFIATGRFTPWIRKEISAYGVGQLGLFRSNNSDRLCKKKKGTLNANGMAPRTNDYSDPGQTAYDPMKLSLRIPFRSIR